MECKCRTQDYAIPPDLRKLQGDPVIGLAVVLPLLFAAPADPFLPTDPIRWGFRNGIQVAIHPAAISTGGSGGPRGLLRIGYPILPNGGVSLINFIAVEPTVAGRKGFSELERGADGLQGKRFTVMDTKRTRGRVEVSLDVEPFQNGAHVRLELVFDASNPDEVTLRAFDAPGSAAMQQCALTATMGNYARLRRVYLADCIAESGSVYLSSRYFANGFAPDFRVPLSQLVRDEHGGVIAAAAPDEADPQVLQSILPEGYFWRFPGTTVAQYWQAPRGSFSPDLTLRLNGRKTYWMTNVALPGGVAFENFELQDRFRSGQPFVFGVTPKSPESLLVRPPEREKSQHPRFDVWD